MERTFVSESLSLLYGTGFSRSDTLSAVCVTGLAGAAREDDAALARDWASTATIQIAIRTKTTAAVILVSVAFIVLSSNKAGSLIEFAGIIPNLRAKSQKKKCAILSGGSAIIRFADEELNRKRA